MDLSISPKAWEIGRPMGDIKTPSPRAQKPVGIPSGISCMGSGVNSSFSSPWQAPASHAISTAAGRGRTLTHWMVTGKPSAALRAAVRIARAAVVGSVFMWGKLNAAFIDSSSDFTQLNWTFSNGEISQEENPFSVFPFNDTLSAVLIVQNGACRDTFSFSEYITDISSYYKENDANAFSPNGDGKNDCFSPAMQLATPPQDIAFVPCSELKVFNRWGEILFDSALENNVCWNGKSSSGETLPEGVYFYQYRFGESNKAGFVHLKLN